MDLTNLCGENESSFTGGICDDYKGRVGRKSASCRVHLVQLSSLSGMVALPRDMF